jgi:sugar-specific transcriptional regulator TrmB
MNVNQVLQNIGLSEKEAKVYLVLLEFQEALPSTIAKRADIKRPTTYVILERLVKKGLVSHFRSEKTKVKHYRALNPNFLVESQQEKTEDLIKALPKLLNLNDKYESPPQMTVYEGKEGYLKLM